MDGDFADMTICILIFCLRVRKLVDGKVFVLLHRLVENWAMCLLCTTNTVIITLMPNHIVSSIRSYGKMVIDILEAPGMEANSLFFVQVWLLGMLLKTTAQSLTIISKSEEHIWMFLPLFRRMSVTIRSIL